jgi:hypothetical protein
MAGQENWPELTSYGDLRGAVSLFTSNHTLY